jgi:hypothetical protein
MKAPLWTDEQLSRLLNAHANSELSIRGAEESWQRQCAVQVMYNGGKGSMSLPALAVALRFDGQYYYDMRPEDLLELVCAELSSEDLSVAREHMALFYKNAP